MSETRSQELVKPLVREPGESGKQGRGLQGPMWAEGRALGRPESSGLRHPRKGAKGKGRAGSFASALVTRLHLPVGIFLGKSSTFVSLRDPDLRRLSTKGCFGAEMARVRSWFSECVTTCWELTLGLGVRVGVQRDIRQRPVLEGPTALEMVVVAVTDVNRMSLHGDRSGGRGDGRQGLELTGPEGC